MEQAVLARGKLDEGAEVFDADNGADVDLAHLGFFDDAENGLLGGFASGALDGGDMHGAVFLDFDRRTRLFLQAADDLAAGADDVADLVDGNLDRLDAGRRLAQLGAGFGDFLEHGVEDEGATFLGLLQGGTEDFGGQALGLVVHLEGGDALGGARYLEVHVAQEVFEALDVGKDDVLVAFLDEAHGDARNRGLDRHAGVHERKGRAAGGSHRARAVGLEDFRYDADGVGEIVFAGQHGQKGAFGEGAMPHLAALGGADAAGLAGAEGREVVLVHIALALLRVDRVETLAFAQGAQGAHRQGLGLTALEEAGTVDARQIAGLDVERADVLGAAAVDALVGVDDHHAHGMLFERLASGCQVAGPRRALFFGEVVLLDRFLEGFDLGDARLLVGVLQGGRHLVVVSVHALGDARVGLMQLVFERLRVDLVEEALLRLAELGDGLLAEVHRREHVDLADLFGACFDHADVVLGTGDREVEIGAFELFVGGIDDEVARFGVAADAHAGHRAVEGRPACEKGRRSAVDADAVGGVFAVDHEGGRDDLHLVLEAVGETRADGTVDHAGREGALFACLALALQVAAGDTAHGVHLFHEVDGQGEEVVVAFFL